MWKLLLALLFYVAFSCPGCSAPQRGNITLRNTTPDIIVITAGAGKYRRQIRLKPGDVWTGWVPRLAAKEIRVEVSR